MVISFFYFIIGNREIKRIMLICAVWFCITELIIAFYLHDFSYAIFYFVWGENSSVILLFWSWITANFSVNAIGIDSRIFSEQLGHLCSLGVLAASSDAHQKQFPQIMKLMSRPKLLACRSATCFWFLLVTLFCIKTPNSTDSLLLYGVLLSMGAVDPFMHFILVVWDTRRKILIPSNMQNNRHRRNFCFYHCCIGFGNQ